MKYCNKYKCKCKGMKCNYFVSRRPLTKIETEYLPTCDIAHIDPYAYDWCTYYEKVMTEDY